jgi:hypothetical protein
VLTAVPFAFRPYIVSDLVGASIIFANFGQYFPVFTLSRSATSTIVNSIAIPNHSVMIASAILK